METKLLTLLLCLFLIIPIQIHVGSFYWIAYLALVYIITFPSGPVQQMLKHRRDRKKVGQSICEKCGSKVNQMDTICNDCKLEISYGSHS